MHTRESVVSFALLATLCALTGCDGRAAVVEDATAGGADGSLRTDGVVPQPDVGPPTPGSVWLRVDRLQASPQKPVSGTVFNGTPQPIWLKGCVILTRQERVDGAWVDRGSERDCAWEGVASPLKPGSERSESAHFPRVGSWRLALRYGKGCDKEKPLNAETCSGLFDVYSQPVKVRATKADCLALDKQYKAALDDAKTCTNLQDTLGPPRPVCDQLTTSGLACGCPLYVHDTSKLRPLIRRYKAWGCKSLLLPCGIKCRAPVPARCVEEEHRCSPMGN
ncbi:MAG: hypothetical protein CSA65_01995 [Proteobacteria bacterium]|nr:MAG: hypothetical protein CSA65_01995 [Pseudomonadota bacterium]